MTRPGRQRLHRRLAQRCLTGIRGVLGHGRGRGELDKLRESQAMQKDEDSVPAHGG